MKASYFTIILLIGFLLSCGQGNERHYQGYVEGENIYLASPYSGILEKLAVRRGQVVKQGELLFTLDPYPQTLAIKQLQNDLQQAKDLLQDLKNPRRSQEIEAIEAQIQQVDAQLQLAKIRVERNQKLYEKQAVDKDRVDEAVALYEQQKQLKAQYQANLDLAKLGSREEQIKAQQAQVQSIAARLKDAEWQLTQKTLYAPGSGIIFDTFYREGEFVGTQQAVLALLTPQNVYIEFFVPVEELTHLKVGNTVLFTCMGCKDNYKATLRYISPEAEYAPPLIYSRENQDKLVFRIQASLATFNQFKPGQPVTVMVK